MFRFSERMLPERVVPYDGQFEALHYRLIGIEAVTAQDTTRDTYYTHTAQALAHGESALVAGIGDERHAGLALRYIERLLPAGRPTRANEKAGDIGCQLFNRIAPVIGQTLERQPYGPLHNKAMELARRVLTLTDEGKARRLLTL